MSVFHKITGLMLKILWLATSACCPVAAASTSVPLPRLDIVASHYPPYFDEGKKQSFMGRIISAAMERAGYKAHIKVMPYARAIREFSAGSNSIGFFGEEIVNPQGDQAMECSFFMKFQANFFYAKTNSSLSPDVDHARLKGMSVGVQRGNTAEYEHLKKFGFKVVYANTYDQLFRMLITGRIDLLNTVDYTFYDFLKKHNRYKDAIATITKAHHHGRIGLCFKGRDRKLLRQQFETGLRAAHSSQDIQKIFVEDLCPILGEKCLDFFERDWIGP